MEEQNKKDFYWFLITLPILFYHFHFSIKFEFKNNSKVVYEI